jgi:hypothetical protein
MSGSCFPGLIHRADTRSPNLADAIVMAYWPVGDGVYSSME